MVVFKININKDISADLEVAVGRGRVVVEGDLEAIGEWVKVAIPGKIDDAIIDIAEKWAASQV